MTSESSPPTLYGHFMMGAHIHAASRSPEFFLQIGGSEVLCDELLKFLTCLLRIGFGEFEDLSLPIRRFTAEAFSKGSESTRLP